MRVRVVNLVVLTCVWRTTKKVVNFLARKSAPPEKILATRMKCKTARTTTLQTTQVTEGNKSTYTAPNTKHVQ